jgi:predicted nucleotide-binding protein
MNSMDGRATIETLLIDVVACRAIVEDYAKRLDDACREHYDSGKTLFPDLTRAEEEEVSQQCFDLLQRLEPTMPDAIGRWKAIDYPSGKEAMVVKMRDMWVRRRNLFRSCEYTLRAKMEMGRPSTRLVIGSKRMTKNESRVLIIHGHDERNLLALKDLLQTKMHLPEPVIMRQQVVPGASLPEKFEKLAASVDFAVALLTPDDLGRALTDRELKSRPRQNTLVEIGWFWGRLGRDRILLLVKEELELPSDLQGVEYHRFASKVEDVSEKVRDFFEAHRHLEGS